MDLLRFTTAGSVDDGKSTLIGRLLYDSKNTFEDQMEAVVRLAESLGVGSVKFNILQSIARGERMNEA
mgnify:CR=1 FL=1